MTDRIHGRSHGRLPRWNCCTVTGLLAPRSGHRAATPCCASASKIGLPRTRSKYAEHRVGRRQPARDTFEKRRHHGLDSVRYVITRRNFSPRRGATAENAGGWAGPGEEDYPSIAPPQAPPACREQAGWTANG
jgi:hypothetical protein